MNVDFIISINNSLCTVSLSSDISTPATSVSLTYLKHSEALQDFFISCQPLAEGLDVVVNGVGENGALYTSYTESIKYYANLTITVDTVNAVPTRQKIDNVATPLGIIATSFGIVGDTFLYIDSIVADHEYAIHIDMPLNQYFVENNNRRMFSLDVSDGTAVPPVCGFHDSPQAENSTYTDSVSGYPGPTNINIMMPVSNDTAAAASRRFTVYMRCSDVRAEPFGLKLIRLTDEPLVFDAGIVISSVRGRIIPTETHSLVLKDEEFVFTYQTTHIAQPNITISFTPNDPLTGPGCQYKVLVDGAIVNRASHNFVA